MIFVHVFCHQGMSLLKIPFKMACGDTCCNARQAIMGPIVSCRRCHICADLARCLSVIHTTIHRTGWEEASASRGPPYWGFPSKPPVFHSNMVQKGLRRALNWPPIMPRELPTSWRKARAAALPSPMYETSWIGSGSLKYTKNPLANKTYTLWC